MRIGFNTTPPHQSPDEWGDILTALGLRAAVFPVDYTAPVSLIDAYVKAAAERDIRLAEVGAWCSPFLTDKAKAEKAAEYCKKQFELADYVKADCCVNISGAAGEVWNGCYKENYSEALYHKNVEFIQKLIDDVRPQNTYYTLEPMQWMIPHSPKQYLQILNDVDRERFAVHMDLTNFIRDPYTFTHRKELLRESFELLGGKIKSCHIKDCLMESGTSVIIREVPLGEGVMELTDYLDAIKSLPGDIPVLLEHLPDMETYERSLAYLKGIYEL